MKVKLTCLLFLLVPLTTSAYTDVYTDITSDTIWDTSGSPYIVQTELDVESGVKLEINAGVVVKMIPFVSISVAGMLEINGTDTSPVYVTSLYDSSVGGETVPNNVTLGPGLWGSINILPGGALNIEHTNIYYGGRTPPNYSATFGAGILNQGGDVIVDSSYFLQNYNSIKNDLGTTTVYNTFFDQPGEVIISVVDGNVQVENSSFVGYGYGIYTTPTAPVVLAENNWWRDPNGPYDLVNNPNLNGINVLGNIDYTPWLLADPNQAQTIDPVIIIPGMLGSAFKGGKWLIDPIFHVYDNLIETLEANGYTKDTNLFPWGYDWRKSNIETAQLLKQKIDDVKNICNCSQVDIVAHSMGGLVTRAYAQSAEYGNDIDQIVFLGTPHRGAPEDYLVWEAGEFRDDLGSRFVKSYVNKEAKRYGYAGLFDYVHGWPIVSVSELLPVYDYLKSATTTNLLNYPAGYPVNNFLENLNQGLAAFLASDIDITNIVGDAGNNTISTIRITDSNLLPLWEHGYPEGYNNSVGDKGLEMGIGDGTVPEYSSKFGSANDLEISSSHINLPTEAEEEIYTEIHGGTLVSTVKKLIPVRMLFVKIFSPADFVIIAPDGKKIGKDFATGQEVNEIQGAFYSGFDTDDEYVTIPDPMDGNYQVQLQGTGSGGRYAFETSHIDNDEVFTSEVVGIITPSQITALNVEVDSNNPEEITLEREITLEVLISDINGAYNLGWIKDKKTRDGLIKQAKLTIKFEKKRNGKYEKRVDKILIRVVKKELELLLKKGKINESVFNLLEDDLNWIINNN